MCDSLVLKLEMHATMPSFYTAHGDQNSGTHARVVGTVVRVPSPQGSLKELV